MTKRKIPFQKTVPLLIFQTAPSTNTLDGTDWLTDHEKHIENWASFTENIPSTTC